mgnify:CR=1 FL=1
MVPRVTPKGSFRFNPRSRGGSDFVADSDGDEARVSIHAPAGGATSRTDTPTSTNTFQSTLPRGERPTHAAR